MKVPQIKMPPQGQGHSFAKVPQARIERSTLDRSHSYKTTFNEGLLIPFLCDEALPGDTFHVQMTAFARLTTPIKPLMDNMYMDVHFFAVPIRLIWTHWVNLNGEQVNPGDSTSFTVPQFTAYTAAELSLSDYMGIPTHQPAAGAMAHNSLWHRAYNLIYNQWYRDENLINSATVDTGDGPDAIANYTLRRRGKRHDYFTSCLPWPQKGTAVSIPLGTTAPIIPSAAGANPTWLDAGDVAHPLTLQTAGALPANIQGAGPGGGTWAAGHVLQWGATGLAADLTNATAATINALRQSFQIQKLLERDARGGTRYTEIIKAHFGVTSPDARLQRSEYLGGGSTPVNIAPIPQSTPTPAAGTTTPQGNLAAIGTAIGHGMGFVKSFTEHCILLGIMSVRADLTYQQGMERMFQRRTRYDFYWPAFAHIGEQAVMQYEIGVQGVAADLTTVFGYQERYGEYRYKPSKVTGQYRSNATTPLDVWGLWQNFSLPVTLNQTFIEENAPMSRVVAVTTEPHFYFDSAIKMICARPMPVFGVPGFIDHF